MAIITEMADHPAAGSAMRRLSIVLSIVAVALLGLIALGRSAVTAQEATPTAADRGIVGTWRVIARSPGFRDIFGHGTFAADGSYTEGSTPVSPAMDGFPATVTSGGQGVWEDTGDNTGAYTFEDVTSTIEGDYVARTTIRGTLELSEDGQLLTGDYTFTVAAPDSTVLFAGPGTFEGTAWRSTRRCWMAPRRPARRRHNPPPQPRETRTRRQTFPRPRTGRAGRG